MNVDYYEEMLEKVHEMMKKGELKDRILYVFGHCNATEKLVDLLLDEKYNIEAILDNNKNKQGKYYKGILIISPTYVLKDVSDKGLVLIASRAYASMVRQLEEMGYKGAISKLVDFNSFSEYSLKDSTIVEKVTRRNQGIVQLEAISNTHEGKYLIICPYAALGDVYYAMAYLPYFLRENSIECYLVLVVGKACAKVVTMFGHENVEILIQKQMDELVQAILYTRVKNGLIVHHDRPYTNQIIKVLHYKLIPFESLYHLGIYGLEVRDKAYEPRCLKKYSAVHLIKQGKTVILAPYAKSIANISIEIWNQIVCYFRKKGYFVCTNICDNESPLEGTIPLEVSLDEMQNLVEYAGVFIGIRSGLCDVLKNANCRKIALYPDCYYSDTRWKVVDFFRLEGWENIVVGSN